MSELSESVSIDDLQQDAAAVIKRVRKSKAPIAITKDGQSLAIVMSLDAYAAAEDRQRMLETLLRSEQEIREGKGHTLEEVFAIGSSIGSSGTPFGYQSRRVRGEELFI